jgi:radical SAM superfamily enzyme YgiQ (UPF0313 family)
MKILLINPEIPDTFWSFRHALKFIKKRSSEPPLGLLTVAALLPADWHKQLIDMNVEVLRDEQLTWADYVFLTGMHVQKKSFDEVVCRCKALGVKVVAGGPMCTMEPDDFPGVDHLILNEAEITLPLWLKDLQAGEPRRIYTSAVFPQLSVSPKPLWELLDMKKYASISIQYSRGCPFHCDFCSITVLNGHVPRTKRSNQFLAELDAIYQTGWRGRVFIVDDNFIGNKRKLKADLLPALIKWSEKWDHPFNFMTETSINVADDEELLAMMVKAGFDAAFIGIESPNLESLMECGKSQNRDRDLVGAVKKLQSKGIIVSGGFIVGFDNDPHTIFDEQINFIQKSGIVTAMVGLLNAQPGTRLFERLKKENRISKRFEGDNMDGTINFLPKMNTQFLLAGYKRILQTIYAPRAYYRRIEIFLRVYRLPGRAEIRISLDQLQALFRSFWVLGIVKKGRRYFWKFVVLSLVRYPRKFHLAITMAVYGFHFRQVARAV